MKKIATVVALMALVALSAAFACDKTKNTATQAAVSDPSGGTREVALTGYLTDSNCGAANANAKGKSCAARCIKRGAKVQLYANEKLYTLDKAGVAEDQFGVPVKVTGVLDESTGTIKVASIEVVKEG
ncbi:MAG: hypothetical protein AUG74_10270 [Bacteroidetes bacterium 13_1_20CM_4_60_6]|nr:MAG: hypothetical protein AUG74_10270 [Bacteroidetes bacterium 13_1_20CM_4_60_6]